MPEAGLEPPPQRSGLPTGAGRVVLTMFGPLIGAHVNSAATLAIALRREIGARTALACVAAQVAGEVVGVWAAHLMFAGAGAAGLGRPA